MKLRSGFDYPPEKKPLERKAIRLEVITIAGILSVIVGIGLTMGSSQAMKTAWIEDMLALVPPIAYLISVPIRRRGPSEMFPFGHQRAGHIAFMAASVALTMFGLLLLYEAVMALARREHPTIGTTVIFGRQFWSGWLMIAALLYSMIIPMVLGRLKLSVAHALHEKTLYTDAQMNKDDWLTAGAAIVGILGIGLGWWWADAAASGVISFEVTRDGAKNLKNVVYDLMDARPRTLEGKPEMELEHRVLAAVLELDWVRNADLRLREEGSMVTGEVLVVPVDESRAIRRTRQAIEAAEAAHWRCSDIAVILVDQQELKSKSPAQQQAGSPE